MSIFYFSCFPLWFRGGTLVLLAPFPGHCLPFTSPDNVLLLQTSVVLYMPKGCASVTFLLHYSFQSGFICLPCRFIDELEEGHHATKNVLNHCRHSRRGWRPKHVLFPLASNLLINRTLQCGAFVLILAESCF